MKLFSVAALLFLLGPGISVASGSYRCQPDFAIPAEFRSDPDFHPIGYLESCHVPDTTAQLPHSQLVRLRALFVAAADACQAKYHQDYPLATSAPLYRLLLSNVPGLRALESEKGRVVFLGRIAQFLRTQPTPTVRPPSA